MGALKRGEEMTCVGWGLGLGGGVKRGEEMTCVGRL